MQRFEIGLDDVKPERKKASKKTQAPRKKTSNTSRKKVHDKEEISDVPKRPINTRLIIGVDFGTTYSGVAFARSTVGPGKINIVKNVDEFGDERDKVPSVISMKDASDDASSIWGYRVKHNMSSAFWFKLGMGGKENWSSQDDPLLAQSSGEHMMNIPEGETADSVGAKYIEHLIENSTQFISTRMPNGLLETIPRSYIFVAPADWGQPYKNKLRDIAKSLGIGAGGRDTISMIDEPEAAALAAFTSSTDLADAKDLFEVKTNVVVADMGGGTVDVTTYSLNKLVPFRISEACSGISARCGGTSIERGVYKLIGDRHGVAFSHKKPEEIGPGSQFMRRLESFKRTFLGENKEYRLPLDLGSVASDSGYDAEAKEIILTRDEMVDMFDRVLGPCIGLLKEQISRSIELNGQGVRLAIVCGGLSGSPWVAKKLEEYVAESLGSDAGVIIPVDPWSAIARGAVIHGLNVNAMVDGRKCRRSYGICVHQEFDPEKHDEADAFICPVNGKRARECMVWHIRKDQVIKDGAVARINAYVIPRRKKSKSQKGKPASIDLVGEIQVYKCADADPPHILNAKVEVLGTIKIDFNRASTNQRSKARKVPRKNRKGQTNGIAIKIEHLLHPTDDEVEFRVMVARAEVGVAKFEYEPAQDLHGSEETIAEDVEMDEEDDDWNEEKEDEEEGNDETEVDEGDDGCAFLGLDYAWIPR